MSDIRTFDTRDIEKIETMAGGLQPQAVLDYFGIDYDTLDPQDKEIFERAYRRGRTIMLSTAVDRLKQQMSGKNGVAASLAVLSRFASGWEMAPDAAGARSFRVVLDD